MNSSTPSIIARNYKQVPARALTINSNCAPTAAVASASPEGAVLADKRRPS